MGRRVRIDFEGAWHHVMHRGAGRRTVYRDDAERRIFLRLVGDLEQRFGLEVHAFVLMDNHFHLLIRSGEARLSEGMQWLLGNFTRSVNTRRGVDGAIFRGRFHAVSVLSEAHRYLLFRYLPENAVDLRPPVDPVVYEWSSLSSIAAGTHGRRWPWLHGELVEEWYGERAELLVACLSERSSSHSPERGDALRHLDTDIGEQVARVSAAADAAAGLSGAVERKALRTGAMVTLIDGTGRWSRSALGDAVGLTTSAVGSTIHRMRRSCETDSAVDRYLSRVAEMAAGNEIPAPITVGV